MILLDATKLRAAMQCQRKFYWQYRLHLEPAGSKKIDLLYGGLVHDGLEMFENLFHAGKPKDESLIETLATLNDRAKELDIEEYEDEHKKTRQTLFRALIWYAEQFYDSEPVLTPIRNEIPFRVSLLSLVQFYHLEEFAAELGLAHTLENVVIGGRLDSLVEGPSEGEFWVRERKTTAQSLSNFFFMRYSPDIQTSLYPMVSRLLFPEIRIKGVVLEAIQIAVGFIRFERREIPKYSEQSIESLRAILKTIADLRNAGLLNEDVPENLEPDFNETACMAGGGPCNFRDVCNAHPAARRDMLRQFFKTREPWSPLSEASESEIVTA